MQRESLEHVIRCWQAEEENARRISSRRTLIVGIPAGFIAFLGASADPVARLLRSVFEPSLPASERAIAALGSLCVAVGALSFLVSAGAAVGIRRGAAENADLASRRLHPLNVGQIKRLAEADAVEARRIAYIRTLTAAQLQMDRNEDAAAGLLVACGWLLAGIGLTFPALLAYTWIAD